MKEKVYHSLGMELTDSNLILTHIVYLEDGSYSIGDIVVQGLEEGLSANGLVLNNDEVVKILSAAVNGFGEKKIKRTSFSIPSNDDSGIVKVIQVPNLNPKEIKKIINSSSEDELLHPAKELYINWTEVQKGVINEDGSISIILVGALKSHVDSQMKILKKSRLKPYFAELDLFSIIRALLTPKEIKDKTANKLIIDLSSKESELIFLRNSRFQYARPIPFGAKDCITAIAEHMDITEKEAKTEFLDNAAIGSDIFSLPFSQQIVAEALNMVVIDAVENIAETIDFYKERFNSEVDEILITGTTSRIEGLCELIESRTGTPTFLGKPYMLYQSEVIEEDSEAISEDISTVVSSGISLDKKSDEVEESDAPIVISYESPSSTNYEETNSETVEDGFRSKRWNENEKKIKIPEAVKSIGLALKEVFDDVQS